MKILDKTEFHIRISNGPLVLSFIFTIITSLILVACIRYFILGEYITLLLLCEVEIFSILILINSISREFIFFSNGNIKITTNIWLFHSVKNYNKSNHFTYHMERNELGQEIPIIFIGNNVYPLSFWRSNNENYDIKYLEKWLSLKFTN